MGTHVHAVRSCAPMAAQTALHTCMHGVGDDVWHVPHDSHKRLGRIAFAKRNSHNRTVCSLKAGIEGAQVGASTHPALKVPRSSINVVDNDADVVPQVQVVIDGCLRPDHSGWGDLHLCTVRPIVTSKSVDASNATAVQMLVHTDQRAWMPTWSLPIVAKRLLSCSSCRLKLTAPMGVQWLSCSSVSVSVSSWT